MSDVALALLLGFGAGTLSGLLGVGGAVLFIPAFTLTLGMTQFHAQATSLAAMLPALAVGAWRQNRHGNVCWHPAVVIGLVSALGVAGGVVLARSLPEGVLRTLFASLLVAVALRLAWVSRRA